MWITILVMAIAMSMEPFRIGMTVLMLNRPRPMLQLIAFLSGGFAMGAIEGLVVIGVLALLMAALLAAGFMPAPKLPAQARGLVSGQSLWVATVAGLGIALPSVDYLAVLAVIVTSGAAPSTQVAGPRRLVKRRRILDRRRRVARDLAPDQQGSHRP